MDLKQCSTGYLMKLRNKCYASDYEDMDMAPTLWEVLAELNTREHYPDKKEARKIRQRKAKLQRSK